MSIFVAILLVTTLLLPGCSSGQSSETSSWSVHVKTSGGLTGRGNGDVLIDSKGLIVYEKPNFPNKPSSPCKGALSEVDLREMKDAVAQTKPAGWKVAGLAIAAPDAFGYSLTLDFGREIHEVKWYDNTSDELPADLKTLYEAISRLKEKQAKKCSGL